MRITTTVLLAALALGRGFALGPGSDYDPTTLVYPPFRHCLGLHRVTVFHLFVYLGTRTRFNEPAGISAVKLDIKDDPTTTSDDDELTVFGLNSGEGEIIYNTSLTEVRIYGEPGSGPGQFRNPLGIAATSDGDVFVADTGNDRVVQLAYRDDELTHVRSLASSGFGDRRFSRPSQVAVGASGALYVTDTGNDRIVVLPAPGERGREIRADSLAPAGLERPTGLAVVEGDDPWIAGDLEFLVVSDRGATRLVKLSLEGSVLASLEAAALPAPGATFEYLAIDHYGSIYATDRANCQIHKFDWKLNHVASFGRCGAGNRELDEPRGITLWRRFGQIFVTERAGAQYFWIGTEIQKLEVSPAELSPRGSVATITYHLTEVSRVTVEVLDRGGTLVSTLVSHRRRAIGDNIERWDGTQGRGRPAVAPGLYTLRITAAPTYSSGTYFHDTAEKQIKVLAETLR